MLARQVQGNITNEVATFAQQARLGVGAGINAVARRSNLPNAGLYLLTDGLGHKLAGNVSEVPAGLLDTAGEDPIVMPYARDEGAATEHRNAVVRVVQLPGGFKMLVGRDIA